MDSFRPDLPQDIEACHALIDRLEEERRQQAQTITQQQATIERPTVDVALLKRALFGSRRERFLDDPRQKYLFESVELNAGEDAGPQVGPCREVLSLGHDRR